MKTTIEYLNPDGLPRNPAFSQAVAVSGPHRTVFVGGQNAVNALRQIVGKGDFAAQAEQALANLETALAAGGARLADVVTCTIYIVQGQPAQVGFEVFRRKWQVPKPPAISVVYVAALAHPDFLIEINAIAVVPEEP